MPLVRIGKRRLAWEESEPAEIARIEFRDRDGNLDLRPSVYEVDAVDAGVPHRGQIVRVHDEHAVSVISPPRGGDDLIVDGAFEVEEEYGETLFSFANERHRELRFPDEPALIAFVGVLMGSRSERRVQLGRDELFAYIAARLDGDTGLAADVDTRSNRIADEHVAPGVQRHASVRRAKAVGRGVKHLDVEAVTGR